jgi:hypothetical protein
MTSRKQENRTPSKQNSVPLYKDRNGPICLSPWNSDDDDDDDDDDDSKFPLETCVFVWNPEGSKATIREVYSDPLG